MADDQQNKKPVEEEQVVEDVASLETAESEKISQLEQQLEEATNLWKRSVADYRNLEKRTEEQKGDFVRFALKKFIEKLLTVADDLELAQAHLKDSGLGLAVKKLLEVLKQEGLERIETKDREYDFETMEAINIIEGKTDNKVVAEHRAGYTMHGSVLRPAHVTVSKKSSS